jgi:hypothetical protein
MASTKPYDELTITTRQGHPDFLDLPWEVPLEGWTAETAGIVRIPRGLSRHVVRMVDYEGQVYAVKETSPALADSEFRMLRRLEDEHMPSVTPVGVVQGRRSSQGDDLDAVLITRYLEFSLPYQYLFRSTFTEEVRNRLLDAAVVLLARLHLEGFFWGDISLANVLFRRDAGALMAYLVDAETGEWQKSLSTERRRHDLTIARENIGGGLLDAQAAGYLPADVDPVEIVNDLENRYDRLWWELTREDEVDTSERWRIRQRVERLNELGFDVEEMSVSRSADGSRLRFRPVVLEEGHAHLRLRRLTGLEAQENQARQLLNALDAYGLLMERQAGRALPEAIKAYRWLTDNYEPVIEAIPDEYRDRFDDAELIHEFIEHRFARSIAENRQVENDDALETFKTVLAERPGERFVRQD